MLWSCCGFGRLGWVKGVVNKDVEAAASFRLVSTHPSNQGNQSIDRTGHQHLPAVRAPPVMRVAMEVSAPMGSL